MNYYHYDFYCPSNGTHCVHKMPEIRSDQSQIRSVKKDTTKVCTHIKEISQIYSLMVENYMRRLSPVSNLSSSNIIIEQESKRKIDDEINTEKKKTSLNEIQGFAAWPQISVLKWQFSRKHNYNGLLSS